MNHAVRQWPAEGLTRIPDWVYTDQTIYEREVEKIFHGCTWNYVALECEVPKAGDFIRRGRVRRTLEALTGLVLIGLGLRLATEGR